MPTLAAQPTLRRCALRTKESVLDTLPAKEFLTVLCPKALRSQSL